MFKTILVPIDMGQFDEGKANIEVAAKQLAEGGRIVLLNVIEEIPGWAAAELPANLIEQSRTKARSDLQALADATGADALVEVRSGHPYKTILDVAEENSVELIIVASHKPGLQDYFLGSTAAKVVRHARCSVLVIR